MFVFQILLLPRYVSYYQLVILILFVCGGGSGAYRAKRARLHCCAIDCFCLDADMVFQKEVRVGVFAASSKGRQNRGF